MNKQYYLLDIIECKRYYWAFDKKCESYIYSCNISMEAFGFKLYGTKEEITKIRNFIIEYLKDCHGITKYENEFDIVEVENV